LAFSGFGSEKSHFSSCDAADFWGYLKYIYIFHSLQT
jgi:hypothetical protein